MGERIMDIRIGFIGCGNMSTAMIDGIIRSGLVPKDRIFASRRTETALQQIKEKYGIQTTGNNKEVAEKADIIVLGVKPNMYPHIMRELVQYQLHEKIYISLAPGKTLAFLEEGLGKGTKIIRTMPNTPAMVGAGITAVCPNTHVTQEEFNLVMNIMRTFGAAERVDESLFDAVVAVSGSSPAYVFMFIEAMADAAVKEGMPRKQAYTFAAQAVLGSAKLMLETGKHPAELKDMVCSPAGTTIEAVAKLEENGFRPAVMQAMAACAAKAKRM